MSSSQIRICAGTAAAVFLCWLTAPWWGAAGAAPPGAAVPPDAIRFDAGRAHQTARDFATRNPGRNLGSLESWQAAADLLGHLKALGYDVRVFDFDAVVAGRRQTGRNVVAFRQGELPAVIAVVAHYDTPRTPNQDGAENSAGIGAMLELARVFVDAPLRHSVMVVAADGGEWGSLGASDLAAHHPERLRLSAVLSLDPAGPAGPRGLRLDSAGLGRGHSPAWLRRLARTQAEAEGLPVAVSSGYGEFVERAIPLSLSDQGPFVNAGIAAINLSGGPSGPEREGLHPGRAPADNMTTAGLGAYGRAAERILRAIDGMPATPAFDGGVFCWRDDTYLSGTAMLLLQCLAFLPLLAMTVFAAGRSKGSLSPETIIPEAVWFLAWLSPFALAYSLLLFCRLMRWLPWSTLYPGPWEDPILENPAWGVLGTIFALALAVGTGLHFLARHFVRKLGGPASASSAALKVFLLGLSLVALLHNPYWAVTFLGIPALVWGALGEGRAGMWRFGGAGLILAAGLASCMAAYSFARGFQPGGSLEWYAALGLCNGMFRWQGYFLASAAAVLGLRLLAHQLSGPARQSAGGR